MTTPELIIPHVKRNNNLLIRNISFIQKNICPPKIHIITKGDNIQYLKDMIKSENILFYDEDNILEGLTYSNIKFLLKKNCIPDERTGWYLQQFIKLGWAKTPYSSEYYATWDSDTFPLRKINFFDKTSNKPIFYIKKEYNEAYFQTMQTLWGLNKKTNFSFIAETMIFNKDMVNELLDKISSPFYEQIIEASAKTIRCDAGFSEFETYGTYILSNFPTMYTMKKIKSFRMGSRAYGMHPSDADLFRASLYYETISFESWARHIPSYIALQKFISNIIFILFGKKKSDADASAFN